MAFHRLPYELVYCIVEKIIYAGSLYECLWVRQLSTLFNRIVLDILFQRGEIFDSRFRNMLHKFSRRRVGRSFIQRYLEAFVVSRRHESSDVREIQHQLYEAFLAVHFELRPHTGSEEVTDSFKDLKINLITQNSHRSTARKLADMLMQTFGEQASFEYALQGRVAGFREKEKLITRDLLTSVNKNEKHLWVLATAILSSDLKMFHIYLEHFRAVFSLRNDNEEMIIPQHSSKQVRSEDDWNTILNFCLSLSLREPTDTVIILRTLTIDREMFKRKLVVGDNDYLASQFYYSHIVQALQIQHKSTRHVTLQLLLGFSNSWRWLDVIGGMLGEAAKVNDCHLIDLVVKSIRDHGVPNNTWRRTELCGTNGMPFPSGGANPMVVCIHYGRWEFLERLLEKSKELGTALHRYSRQNQQTALRFWIASKPSIQKLHIAQKMLLLFGQDCLGIELGWIAAHHPTETLAAFASNINLERPCCSSSADISLKAEYEPKSSFIEFDLWGITHIVHSHFPIIAAHRTADECTPSSISVGQSMLIMAIRHLRLENIRLLVEDYSVKLPTDFDCPGIVHERNEENKIKLQQLKTMLTKNKMSFWLKFQMA